MVTAATKPTAGTRTRRNTRNRESTMTAPARSTWTAMCPCPTAKDSHARLPGHAQLESREDSPRCQGPASSSRREGRRRDHRPRSHHDLPGGQAKRPAAPQRQWEEVAGRRSVRGKAEANRRSASGTGRRPWYCSVSSASSSSRGFALRRATNR